MLGIEEIQACKKKVLLIISAIMVPAGLVFGGYWLYKQLPAKSEQPKAEAAKLPLAKLTEKGLVFSEKAFVETAGKGDIGAIELFLAINMPVDATREIDGYTALMAAAEFDKAEVVRLLAEKGANLNATDDIQQTALIKAAAKGHAEMVQLLLQLRAKVNSCDAYVFSALRYAEAKGYAEAAQKLYEAGAAKQEISKVQADSTQLQPNYDNNLADQKPKQEAAVSDNLKSKANSAASKISQEAVS